VVDVHADGLRIAMPSGAAPPAPSIPMAFSRAPSQAP
jgi:hypothetical protein